MLYTRKGDVGTTRVLYNKDRISKTDVVIQVLGAIDELNSVLGICKVLCVKIKQDDKNELNFSKTLNNTQHALFIIQAEVAGSDKKLTKRFVSAIEKITDEAEKKLPPITSFSLAGGSECGAFLDFARTVARRAERAIVLLYDTQDNTQEQKRNKNVLAYLNRLSSALFALSRLSNKNAGVTEEAPRYK